MSSSYIMDKEEISLLLQSAITCAKYMGDDLIRDSKYIKDKASLKEVIGQIDNYIYRCQQIINDNSTNDE